MILFVLAIASSIDHGDFDVAADLLKLHRVSATVPAEVNTDPLPSLPHLPGKFDASVKGIKVIRQPADQFSLR